LGAVLGYVAVIALRAQQQSTARISEEPKFFRIYSFLDQFLRLVEVTVFSPLLSSDTGLYLACVFSFSLKRFLIWLA
jgi:hypothetical protein